MKKIKATHSEWYVDPGKCEGVKCQIQEVKENGITLGFPSESMAKKFLDEVRKLEKKANATGSHPSISHRAYGGKHLVFDWDDGSYSIDPSDPGYTSLYPRARGFKSCLDYTA